MASFTVGAPLAAEYFFKFGHGLAVVVPAFLAVLLAAVRAESAGDLVEGVHPLS
jgi:uncharacterized protein YqhQ